MSNAKTPADLTITPRDRRFGRGQRQDRLWLNGDVAATAFYNALSVTFPKGEAYFIESVKAFRDGVDEKLAREIKAFTVQEVVHSREHVAFNKRVLDHGYDITRLESRVDQVLAIARSRPKIVQLAATMALEHYTAILAAELIKNPKHLEGADQANGDLWRWHALEEIEHKGVAYDTYLHATRGMSRWKRWKIKSLTMLLITFTFWKHRIEGTLDLMAQDGVSGWRAKAMVAKYLLVSPGIVTRMIPAWISYFLPGFHPWNHDDRALIQKAESDYEAAILPQGTAAA
ncbi:metal-dependent hydrolase [Sphingomonas sp. R647]|jgi:predicted metal-dependent hydrolase|uniref:metal-dependent hydrolase n=1 Tax=Sphingomonas sp. R647 TaxID=2875233 RepID=UPI001CD77649|nr:metal-dependent hydrolase [Sphingomonas sp. R647]MCA1199994.1 metal-dependent hydrolase [Sphingomonas sp. R647]